MQRASLVWASPVLPERIWERVKSDHGEPKRADLILGIGDDAAIFRPEDGWDRWIFSNRADTKLVRVLHGDSGDVRAAAWCWARP